MNDETHMIVDVSTAQNQEEKDKVTKAQIITQLQVGATWAIVAAITNTIVMGQHLATDNLLGIVLGGISIIGSSIGAYGIISTIPKYQQSNLDSQNSNTESEGKTR